MIKLLSQAAAIAAGLIAFGASWAGEAPLEVYNQGALARAFELPKLGETQVLADGATRGSLLYDLTTEYYADGDESESVILDGETDLLTLAFRRGFGAGLELTADVPVMYQGGGFLDQPVQDWHKFFHLPNGGRDEAPNNRYLYTYQRDGVVLLDDQRSGADLGDLRMGLGWQALDSLALRSEVKIGTGKQSHLAGGNSGVALWGDYALPFAASSVLSGFLSAGGSYNGNTGVLHDMQNHFVPLVAGGMAWRVMDHLAILTQLYFHGALYDGSDLDSFRDGLQLAMGFRYHASPDLDFDLGFQEDLITSSSPDFSIHMGLSWRGSPV